MRIRIPLLLLPVILALALYVSGCGGGSSAGTNPGGPDQWTVLVYLNADNDLEPFSIDNVNQMEQVGSSSQVKIVIQWDRSPGFSTADGNWIGCRRYEIERGSKKLIQDMGNVDMGNPQTMKDFVAWGQQNYPASHYCLVVWNHGSGWRSRTAQPQMLTRNISFDDTSNTNIRTADLPGIFSSSPQRLDLVSMDASLMQMAEVAYELRGSADYLVGSEDSPPGEGYPYDKWLGALAANPSIGPAVLGKDICDTYIQAYVGSYPVTQSVIDLSKIQNIAAPLDTFAATLIPFAQSNPAAMASVRSSSQGYSYADYNYRDLLDFGQKAVTATGGSQVASAYNALVSAFNQAVVYEKHTGTEDANSHGLSIWVPDPAAYQLDAAHYATMDLSRDTRWNEFLAAQTQ